MKYIVIWIATLMFVASLANAEHVGDFAAIDHTGVHHQLSEYSTRRAVVLYAQANGCPVTRRGVHDLRAIEKRFQDQNVEFLLLNSNPQDSVQEIREEAQEFQFGLPVLKDETQFIAKTLSIRSSATVVVLDPATQTIVYRGPMNDRQTYDRQFKAAKTEYLAEALLAYLEGQPVVQPHQSVVGCLTSFNDLGQYDREPLSYTADIAPILTERCSECHRDGGVAPWAMTDYDTIAGWSSMIRNVLLTKRMPPGQVDPNVGSFMDNGHMISNGEVQQLLHWIDAGMAYGSGADPLQRVRPKTRTWERGEPDLIVEVPRQEIPGTGIIDYKYLVVDPGISEDRWIEAVEFLPGNAEVLHHAIAYVEHSPKAEAGLTDVAGIRKYDANWSQIMGYTPGKAGAFAFPQNTGRFVAANSRMMINLHYTTTGKPAADASRIGLYFHKKPPTFPLHRPAIINVEFAIPPNDPAYEVSSEISIAHDALLFSVSPHMHYRGKSMRFEAVLPNNEVVDLISIPDYQFDWQMNYVFEEPIAVPAGTRIKVHAVYDNSTANRFNPDPESWVYWGDQTFEEMFIGYVSYRKQGESQNMHKGVAAR